MNKIFLIATHWGMLYGGINSFNYHLAKSISAIAGDIQVYCVVVTSKRPDSSDRLPENLHVINLSSEIDLDIVSTGFFGDAHRTTAISSISGLIFPDDSVIFIGHDIYSGFVAKELASVAGQKTAATKLAVFRHIDFADYQPLDADRSGSDIANRAKLQSILFRSADHVFAVGPVIFDHTKHISNSITEIIPGINSVDYEPGEDSLSFCVFGRIGKEDDVIKQSSVVVAAFGEFVARVNEDEIRKKLKFWRDTRLTLIGTRDEAGNTLRKDLSAHHRLPVNLATFEFVDSPHETIELMRSRGVNVGVVPSLSESFGLVASEFVGLGVPLVLSERTGAFSWLSDNFGGEALGCLTRFSGRGSSVAGTPSHEDVMEMCSIFEDIGHNFASKLKDATRLKKRLASFDWTKTATQVLTDLGYQPRDRAELSERWLDQSSGLQLSFEANVSTRIAEVRSTELVAAAESFLSLGRYSAARGALDSLRKLGGSRELRKEMSRVHAELLLRTGEYQRALALVDDVSNLTSHRVQMQPISEVDLRLESTRLW